jgi:hypothetical protein
MTIWSLIIYFFKLFFFRGLLWRFLFEYGVEIYYTMIKYFLLILSLFSFYDIMAQHTLWEKFPDRFKSAFYNQSEPPGPPEDSKGNKWFLKDSKLYKVNEDTVIYDGFPEGRGKHAEFPDVGPDDAIAFKYAAGGKIYLGYWADNDLEFYFLHDENEFGANVQSEYIVQTNGNIWIDCYQESQFPGIRFDKISKEINPMGADDIIAQSLFYLAYCDNKSQFVIHSLGGKIYAYKDGDSLWRPVIEKQVWMDYSSNSYPQGKYVTDNFIFSTSESDRLYKLTEEGLKVYSVPDLESLGAGLNKSARLSDYGIVAYKNGFVIVGEDKVKTYLYSEFLNFTNVLNSGVYKQKNGQVILYFNDAAAIHYVLIKNETAEYLGSTNFYGKIYVEEGGNFYLFEGKVIGDFNEWTRSNYYSGVYKIKNGTDTTFYPLPEGQYDLTADNKYIWVDHQGPNSTGVSRLDYRKIVLYGNVFYDKNKNGVKEDSEYGVDQFALKLNPSGLLIFTDQNGDFNFSGEINSVYTLEIPEADLFDFTSVQLPFTFNTIEGNLIGISLKNPVAIITPELVVPRSRCSVKSISYLPVVNSGFADAEKIKITIKGNDLGKLSVDENSDAAEGNILEFEITDLKAKTSQKLSYFIEWASGEFTGKFAEFNLKLDVYKDNSVVSVIHDTISSEIRCSWDPNDMAVTPAGVEDLHYTKINSTLSYLYSF